MKGGFEVVRARADSYAMEVPNTGDATRIAAVGESAPLIGGPISSDVGSALVASWTLRQIDAFRNIDDSHGAPVPATVTGVVRLKSPAFEGTEAIIAVDGTAAGVIGEISGQEGNVKFTSVLNYALLTKGSHKVELFVRDENGIVTRVGPPAAS